MLHPKLSAQLANPVMKQAIGYWVHECVVMLGQVKSEKAIKLFLHKKFKGYASPTGIDIIYKLAQNEFSKPKHGTNQQN